MTGPPKPWLGGAVKRLSRLTICSCLLAGAMSASPALAAKEKSPASEKKTEVAEKVGARAAAAATDATKRSEARSKAGKKVLAERLKSLASIWTRVSETQKKAVALEKKANRLEAKALELEAQSRQARSLVEQTETRKARALAKLREMGINEAGEPLPVVKAESEAKK